MQQYMKRDQGSCNDPTGAADWKRFEETLALFEKYGAQYGFDPLMLAAQGYQESTARPEREEPRRRDRRDADHAGDRRGAEGRRHHA